MEPSGDNSETESLENSTSFNVTFSSEDYDLGEDLLILMKIVPFLVPIVFSLIIVTGFIGNLLVVFVVSLNKNMRNTTNLLILNLAIADILFIVFCIPFTAVDYALTSAWPFGDTWCRLSQFLIPATAFVSIYTLVLMALDRYLAVVFPVSSKTIRTERNCQVAILLAWLLSLLLSSPALLLHGLTRAMTDPTQLQCSFSGSEPAYLAFQASFFVLSYFLPLLLIVCLYSVMLYTLWNKAAGVVSKESLRNKRRVVKLITIVTIMFALSWLPIQLILLLKSLNLYPVTIANISVQIGSHVLAYSNSCINPFLYAFLSPPFKAGFLNLIPCMRPRSFVEETIALSRLSTTKIDKRQESRGNKSVKNRQQPERNQELEDEKNHNSNKE